MKTFRFIPIIAAIALFSGCGFSAPKENDTVQEVVQVTAAPVTEEIVPQIQEFSATVQASITNNIAPQMASRIKKIYVEVGDFVTKGQKLVQMDDNNLEQIRTQLENMELSFSRIDELYKVGACHGQNGMHRKQPWISCVRNTTIYQKTHNC